MRFASQPQPGQLSLFDVDESPAVPHAPRMAAPPAPCAPPPPITAPSLLQHPRAQREIVLQGHRVAYEFRVARRRSIGFSVGLDGLSVRAPRWVRRADVEAALHERGDWILAKLAEQQQRSQRLEAARVQWREGASLPFLGEPVVLVIDPRVAGVVLDAEAQGLPGVPRRVLRVGLPHDARAEQLREAVQGWLQRQARRLFEERCTHFAPRLNVRVKRLSLSSAATRWGSASSDGSIWLHWRLIHFTLPVIDYVVAHELAHLREMNHSRAFWDVVRSVVPDYQRARRVLDDQPVPMLD
ncbi:MAG TPA: SprT family zinc-dependent metalloprotease [Burkholderiaceae bacterium]|nr:SprT family zinc-dependent metalloprotease [Burkholderiaceae bacterium]